MDDYHVNSNWYFVTLQYRRQGELTYTTENTVIQKHPVKYLLEVRDDFASDSQLLWWTEIPEDIAMEADGVIG